MCIRDRCGIVPKLVYPETNIYFAENGIFLQRLEHGQKLITAFGRYQKLGVQHAEDVKRYLCIKVAFHAAVCHLSLIHI